MSAATPRLCINCAHIFTASDSAQRWPLCTHQNHGVSLVTGAPLRPSCEGTRQTGKACGPQGLLFQASDGAGITGEAEAGQIAELALQPEPGAYWPEHQAHYAGLMVTPDGRSAWHLVVPDGAQFDLGEMPWGLDGEDIAGAKSVYDGRANTLAMAEAGSELAKAIRALPGDCYLPSQAEALMMSTTLRGKLKGGWHWTSTQGSRYGAFDQSFGNGDSYWVSKVNEFRVLALRRLTLQPFTPSKAGAA